MISKSSLLSAVLCFCIIAFLFFLFFHYFCRRALYSYYGEKRTFYFAWARVCVPRIKNSHGNHNFAVPCRFISVAPSLPPSGISSNIDVSHLFGWQKAKSLVLLLYVRLFYQYPIHWLYDYFAIVLATTQARPLWLRSFCFLFSSDFFWSILTVGMCWAYDFIFCNRYRAHSRWVSVCVKDESKAHRPSVCIIESTEKKEQL